MMRLQRFVSVLVCLAGCLLPGLTGSAAGEKNGKQFTVASDNLVISFDAATGAAALRDKTSGSAVAGGEARCVFADGETRQDMSKGTFTRVTFKNNTLSFDWTDQTGRLVTRQRIAGHPAYIAWTVEPTLGQGRPLWLEAGIQVDCSFPSGGPLKYWDGSAEISVAPALHRRNKLSGTFPMACLYSTKTGIALGNGAFDALSYIENSVLPDQAGRCSLRYGSRLVVDNQVKDSVTFILYTFDSRYGGFRSALQTYYDIFPEAFSPKPDVSPKLSRGSMQNATWASGRTDYQPARLEYVRRSYGDWAWAYAPFKRVGDLYGETDLWNYTTKKPIPSYSAATLPLEKFHQFRKERFHLLYGEVANCFYINTMWCEKKLVEERFPDAQVTREMDPDVTTYYADGWTTGWDQEYKVFPYRTSYETFLKAGMKKLVNELDMYGWAFDCADDIGKYRGPALNRCEGRAFDEKGVYVDVALSIGRVMDYARSLKRGKYAMGVIGNFGAGVFPASFHTDGAIYENPPYLHSESAASVRYFNGRKSLCWWMDYKLDVLAPWETMSPLEIKEAYLALRDNLLLSSFHLGGIPPYTFLAGVPRLYEYMPDLLEAVATGWEPLVPVRIDQADKIWLSRYGRGVRTILCLGNTSDSGLAVNAEVENCFLGRESLVFAGRAGEPVVQEMADGFTRFRNLAIPGRTPVVLKACVGFQPSGRMTATASRRADEFQSVTEVEFLSDANFSTPVLVPVAADKHVQSISLNGKQLIGYSRAGSGVSFRASFKKGKNSLSVILRSETFLCQEADLLAFPALHDWTPGCTIVYPGGNTEAEVLARHVQDYFRFYGETRSPLVRIEIPVVTDAERPKQGNLIVVDTVGGAPRVAIEQNGAGSALLLTGNDFESARETILRLMRVWDKKYVWYGTFPNTTYLYMYQTPDGDYAAKRAGLVGTLLK